MAEKATTSGAGGNSGTRGSQSLQEGYRPIERGGYTPTNLAPVLPVPPPGGSGISPAPQESRK